MKSLPTRLKAFELAFPCEPKAGVHETVRRVCENEKHNPRIFSRRSIYRVLRVLLLTYGITASCLIEKCPAEASSQNVDALLIHLERTRTFLASCSFKFRDHFNQYGEVNYDGSRVRVLEHVFFGDQKEEYSYREAFWDGKKYCIYEEPPDKTDGKIFSELNPDLKDQEMVGLLNYSILLGFVPKETTDHKVPLIDILRASQLTFRDGGDANLSYFQGKWNSYDVEARWDKDANLSFFSMKKNFDDSTLTLENIFEVAEFQANFSDFRIVADAAFPTKVKTRQRLVLSKANDSGNEIIHVPFVQTDPFSVELTLTDVQSRKQFSSTDFQFTNRISDGTPVHMQDVPQIEYIWMDGKIVPKTDEHMLAIARAGHRFMPGPKEPRFWMMTLGAALILFAICAKIYNHRRGVET